MSLPTERSDAEPRPSASVRGRPSRAPNPLSAAVTATALSGTLVLAAFVVAIRLNLVDVPDECWHDAASRAGCRDALAAFRAINASEAAATMVPFAMVPIAIGVVMGALGSASPTRSLGTRQHGTRRRWANVLLLIALLAALAIASEVLAQAREPWLAGDPSFQDAGRRGLSVAIWGFAAWAAARAVSRRHGPYASFAAAALVTYGLWIALQLGRGIWLEHAPRELAMAVELGRGEALVGVLWRDPGGRLLSDADAKALVPPGAISETWLEVHLERLLIVVPGSESVTWAVIEAGCLAGVAGLAIWWPRGRHPSEAG